MTSGTTGLPGSLAHRWQAPLVWVRLFQVFLWLVVAAGPVLALVAVLQVSELTGRVDQLVRAETLAVPVETGPVEGFAELFVASYLTSKDEGSSLQLPSEASGEGGRVARTFTLGTEQVADGYFAVTVAAEIVGARPEPTSETFFYRVGVAETEEGLAAVGPPALIAAPATGSPPDLLVDRMDGLEGVPGLGDALARFLSAYLTGEGELARYAAPGSPLVPVVPPPFASVEIVDAGSRLMPDGGREVVVVVEASNGDGWVQVLQYGVVVTEREGRWEVVDLLAAPSLANE